MNVKYDFTQEGGIPIDQNVFNDLQNGILEAENALASLVGPLVIISGCAVAGNVAANGIVAINGQIMPFIGGAVSTKVIVNPADTALTYFDGSIKDSLLTQYATFGDDGVQNNLWANFVQLPTGGVAAAVDGLLDSVATLGADVVSLDNQVATLQSQVGTLQSTQIIKLASGSIDLGDADLETGSDGQITTIQIGKVLPNTNYQVLLTLNSLAADPGTDQFRQLTIRAKRTNSFDVYFHEMANGVQHVILDWTLISL